MGVVGKLVGALSFLRPRRCYQRLRRLTDRKLLIICNILILLCSVFHTSVGVLIVGLFTYDFSKVVTDLAKTEERTTGLSTYLTQAVLGVYCFVTGVCGLHSARKVDIRLLIVYYWMALVAVGPLFLFGIACIDLKEVLRGWIDHRWNTQEFGWMRQFCCEEGTWDTKCTVPVNGGIEEDSEASWCATHYEGDSDCGAIREAAESKLNIYMTWLLNFNGIVGLTQMVIIIISLKFVERTLTLQVIMSSMLDAINYLLLLPAVACFSVGVFLKQHQDLQVEDIWLNYLFIASSASLLVLAIFGAFASLKKIRSALKLYAAAMIVVVGALSVAGATSFFYVLKVESLYEVKSVVSVQEVACNGNMFGCCCCDEDEAEGTERCPEWSREEIVSIIETDFKLAALIAFVSAGFATRAVRAAYLMINSLKDYKCTYV